MRRHAILQLLAQLEGLPASNIPSSQLIVGVAAKLVRLASGLALVLRLLNRFVASAKTIKKCSSLHRVQVLALCHTTSVACHLCSDTL